MVILHRCRVCFKHKNDDEPPFLSILDDNAIRITFQRKFGIPYRHFLLEKHLVLICAKCHYKLSHETTKEEFEDIKDSAKFHEREHFSAATQQHFGWPSTDNDDSEEEEARREEASRKKKRLKKQKSLASMEVIDGDRGQPGMILRSRSQMTMTNQDLKKLDTKKKRNLYGPKQFVCETCGLKYSYKNGLNRHITKKHKKKIEKPKKASSIVKLSNTQNNFYLT